VHPDRALGFAAATKQAAESKMQFDGLRINLDGFDKRLDRTIRLLVEQKVEALKIGAWKGLDSLTRCRMSTRAAAHPNPKNSGKNSSCQYSNSIMHSTLWSWATPEALSPGRLQVWRS
jgi:hypothetical protein